MAGTPSRERADRRPGDAFVEEALRWLPRRLPGQYASADICARATRLLEPRAQMSPPGSRPRVLVADDNADMRDYVRRMFGAAYDVETVSNGVEALEAIRARRPDLLLSDVMMPVRDGFALLREIRADPD